MQWDEVQEISFGATKLRPKGLSMTSIGGNNTIFAIGNDSYLYSVNSTGKRKWKLKLSGVGGDSIALGMDETIYVSSIGGLFAVNSNGTRKWKYSTGSEVRTSPVIDKNNVIYVGTEDSIHAITSSGKRQWKLNRSATALSLANGRLYAADATGHYFDFEGVLFAVR